MILSTDRFQARLLSLRSYSLQESSSCPCVFFSCVCHCARFPVYTLSQSHTHAAHALQYPSMFSLNISAIGVHLTILTRYRNYSWSRNSDPSETLWIVSTCFDQGCISLNAHMVDGRTLGVARVASPCHHVTMAWSGAMATVATVAWAEALGSIAESQRKPRPAGGRIHTSCEVTNRWKKRDIQILRSIEEHSVTHSYKRLQEATS